MKHTHTHYVSKLFAHFFVVFLIIKEKWHYDCISEPVHWTDQNVSKHKSTDLATQETKVITWSIY